MTSQESHSETIAAGPTGQGEAAPSPRQRFLAACRCRPVDRPPVWLMRQAGRALPEYRALKERYSFLELVQTPELATEVTLQPIRRFGFDAAILFSDILVIPEALGQSYRFREGGGIEMAYALQSTSDLDRLQGSAVRDRLGYVDAALRSIRKALGAETALIGFAGAPWTLANFMFEGGSSASFARARAVLAADELLFQRLCEKLTQAVADYLLLQIEAGVDAVQLFDTLAGTLSDAQYIRSVLPWVRQLVAAVGGRVPVILFAKGINTCWDALADTGASVLSVDATVPLAELRARLPARVGVQGNLDPALLTTTPDRVADQTRQLLQAMRCARGHIVNLGHGVPPEAKLENIAALVDTVRRSG